MQRTLIHDRRRYPFVPSRLLRGLIAHLDTHAQLFHGLALHTQDARWSEVAVAIETAATALRRASL